MSMCCLFLEVILFLLFFSLTPSFLLLPRSETGIHYVTQAGFDLWVPLPQPLKR